ncbi:MAG: glucose-6-phosphate dehydrogenase [Acidobacteria bacterium]|nr:glucose-6-phosphate dehydrogenase [Acidobacteriota bacterium]
MTERVDPVTLVIFGGAGDLAHRKLLPALYNLRIDGLLPSSIAIVGVGRRPASDQAYRDFARGGAARFSRRPVDDAAWQGFAESLFFVPGSLEDPATFASLGARLDLVEHERGLPGNRIYYLAIPPSLFVTTATQLARARFVQPHQISPFARVIVEKPIGRDLESARRINDGLARVFHEDQTFRIDHYLGKETVQNILVLRFANSIFEPLLNRRYVDHVQITVAEAEGVGTRAGYYEQAGALRDMVQNHLLQLLTVTAMEPPFSLGAEVIRDEKQEILRALRPLAGEAVDRHVVRGQYDGYAKEPGVDPASRVETYVALEVGIENWRWSGVPFFLRTGKHLARRASEISIQLKPLPPILFNARSEAPLAPNVLSVRIQPNEGFSFSISSKRPGPSVRISTVKMDFSYEDAFGAGTPEAYERLLLDVMTGDQTLFMRRDGVEAAWDFVTPILARWAERPAPPIPAYAPGSWGPADADRLIGTTGRSWRAP